ncbi:MAG: TerD family protein [Candidatus Melainabacteria bacterium]|nr:TerD family protein [Candidatus Melainabacteria bacterium]
MAIQLRKGETINLTMEAPTLNKIRVGLGWDAGITGHGPQSPWRKVAQTINNFFVRLGWAAGSTGDGPKSPCYLDLDAYCFLLNAQGKCRDERDMVFYQSANRNHFEGAVAQNDYDLFGDGDDESIKVQLDKVNANIERLVFVVSIYAAPQRKQTFGMVKNAFIRLINEETGEELCRADLSDQFSVETSLNFAELYRLNGEWNFKIVSQGYQAGLEKFVSDFGLQLT